MRCYQNGRRNVVVPKASSAEESTWVGLATFAWSGSVLECAVCGVIHRSRQHWYGKYVYILGRLDIKNENEFLQNFQFNKTNKTYRHNLRYLLF